MVLSEVCACVAVRAAEQCILERVNIALSLTFMSSALIVSMATMLTLIAYTSAGNHLSAIQVYRHTLQYALIDAIAKSA